MTIKLRLLNRELSRRVDDLLWRLEYSEAENKRKDELIKKLKEGEEDGR